MGRYFDDAEYQRRRDSVRAAMAKRGLDACLIASPENIYYLTGLDHMGYFAYQTLIFPCHGQPILITRAMERATVRDQVPDVLHIGYSDGTEPEPEAAQDREWLLTTAALPTREWRRRPSKISSAGARATVAALHDSGLGRGVLGIDLRSTFFPYIIAESIMEQTPEATWEDLGTLIDDCRIAQSPAELALTREAAEISESMMLSAIAAAGRGINTREVMAALYDAMFRRGGTLSGLRASGTLAAYPATRTRHLGQRHAQTR